MKVSVITVVFNNKQGLERTLKSVAGQTFNNMEYIVVDGGSTDGTLEIIHRYMNNISVMISEPDKGIYDAMNKGISQAKGEWIIFMNAGDSFYSDRTIEAFLEYQPTFNNAFIVYGDVNLEDGVLSKRLIQKNRNIKYDSICHQGQFIRRDALIDYAGYNIKYKIYADFDFQLEVYSQNKHQLFYMPLCIADYNMLGVSSRPFYKFLAEYLRIVMKVPLAKRIGYYLYAFSFAFKSYLVEMLMKLGVKKT